MAERLLVLRAPSGISGDMFVSGLATLCGLDDAALAAAVARVGLPELVGTARVVPRSLAGIAGVGLEVALPHVHEHRPLSRILAGIAASGLADAAKDLAARTFGLLAGAEAKVHGTSPEDVRFHEVGALDSILDVCLASELFTQLAPDRFVCSPLPVCDGVVRCAHGLLATPAPAVLHLIEGMPVYGIESTGETITPTAAALLRALNATFGPWPALVLERHVRAFGGRVLPDVPNGAVFALGRAFVTAETASDAATCATAPGRAAGTDSGHAHEHDHGRRHGHFPGHGHVHDQDKDASCDH